ncbi:thiolase family protein [Desulfosporosinus sp.]|uniref:thiolase family protein n=1 Tax=Desulfosporosinus sp. TaxID=157907 RepID=UPI002318FE73|nr:thiolase family protein [Desulfosporosinus sp.]MCO5387911.1 thiolase family protein [Desulfosporosinus sp.]MDA8224030.1 thiolase family protein [Desulfitobacterium hafniense]
MKEVVIVSAVRTPVGTIGGTLKGITPQELGGMAVKEAVARAGVSPDLVETVIMGWSRQTTEAANIARNCSLLAGIPEEASAYTVHCQCAASLKAISNGTQEIQTGRADVVVAGGTESLSRAPFYLKNARYGYGAGDGVLVDSLTEAGPGGQPASIYGVVSMGDTAENVAEQFNVSRKDQDQFAFQSQQRCQKALQSGVFKDEIVPVEIKSRKGTVIFDTDEGPKDTSLEKIASLKPVFKKGGSVTAGNSCGRNDAASAIVLMSADKAKEQGIKPLARIVTDVTTGVSPLIMGIGPVPAVRKALKQAGLTLDDIDLIELNEAFASQSLAVIRELGLDMEKTNVNGGAIALGHPIGATGARLMTTLLYELRRRKGRYGMVTLCIGGGQGMATIIEALY